MQLRLNLAISPPVVSGSNTTAFAIPDGNNTGVNSTISITGAGLVDSLTVTVAITHTRLGDLSAYLSHGDINRFRLFLDNADTSNLSAQYPLTFSATASQRGKNGAIGAGCTSNGIVGFTTGGADASFQPHEPFNNIIGGLAAGDWVLKTVDVDTGTTGSLASWSINITTVPAPVPEPGTYALMLGGLGLLALAPPNLNSGPRPLRLRGQWLRASVLHPALVGGRGRLRRHPIPPAFTPCRRLGGARATWLCTAAGRRRAATRLGRSRCWGARWPRPN